MRNIKDGLWGWYEKGAMQKIERLPSRRQQASCKLIYIAICSASAKRKNSNDIECYKFEIARFASVDEKTVQRYLPTLEILEIIQVLPQERLSNGRYGKLKIRLIKANKTDGQIEESSEKVSGKLGSELSDIGKKGKKTNKLKKGSPDQKSGKKIFSKEERKLQVEKLFDLLKNEQDFYSLDQGYREKLKNQYFELTNDAKNEFCRKAELVTSWAKTQSLRGRSKQIMHEIAGFVNDELMKSKLSTAESQDRDDFAADL